VPVGGGKDSIVTLECLKRSGEPLVLFSLGDAEPIRACIAAAGLPFIRVHHRLQGDAAGPEDRQSGRSLCRSTRRLDAAVQAARRAPGRCISVSLVHGDAERVAPVDLVDEVDRLPGPL
jgi:hypothetical protein